MRSLSWPRLVLSGIIACAAVLAYAIHDLNKTLARAVELGVKHDAN